MPKTWRVPDNDVPMCPDCQRDLNFVGSWSFRGIDLMVESIQDDLAALSYRRATRSLAVPIPKMISGQTLSMHKKWLMRSESPCLVAPEKGQRQQDR